MDSIFPSPEPRNGKNQNAAKSSWEKWTPFPPFHPVNYQYQIAEKSWEKWTAFAPEKKEIPGKMDDIFPSSEPRKLIKMQ